MTQFASYAQDARKDIFRSKINELYATGRSAVHKTEGVENMETAKFDKKYFLNCALVLIVMFGFGLLPPFGEMTQFGMGILGILIASIYGWVTLGFVVPCIAGIIAMVYYGAYETFPECFAVTFGTDTTVMMLACLFICAFMEVLDLTDIIAGKILNLKIAKKSGYAFFFLFLLADWLVSAFSNSALAAVVFINFYRTIAKKAGIAPYTKVNSFVLCGVALAAMMGEIAFPFRPVALTVMTLFTTYTGMNLTFIDYLLYVTLYLIVIFLLYALIGKFILRIDYAMFSKAQIEQPAMSKLQKAGMLAIILMMVAFIFSQVGVPVFTSLGLGGVGLLTVLIMVVVQIDGKPLLQLDQVTAKFNWGIFFYIVEFLPFVGFVAADNVGITETVRVWMAPILSTLPPVAFVVASILCATFFTNFLNNLPVSIIFITIMNVIAVNMTGINMPAATLALIMSGFTACATPSANPGSALVFGSKDLIKASTTVKVGAICCALISVITIVAYYPLMSVLI